VVSSGPGSFVFFSLFLPFLFFRAFIHRGESAGDLKKLLFLFRFLLLC